MDDHGSSGNNNGFDGGGDNVSSFDSYFSCKSKYLQMDLAMDINLAQSRLLMLTCFYYLVPNSHIDFSPTVSKKERGIKYFIARSVMA